MHCRGVCICAKALKDIQKIEKECKTWPIFVFILCFLLGCVVLQTSKCVTFQALCLSILRSFVRGECKDECIFSHDLKNPNALQVWQKHGVDARNKTIQELVSMIQGHKKMDGENKIQRRRLTSLGEAPEEKQDKNEVNKILECK